MALKNQINTYADLTAYNADQTKEYPNISYIVATDEVKWQGQDPTLIVAKYNVNTTSSATKLFDTINNISKMWIDGVEQQSLVSLYTFDTTGEHEVKYQLTDDTTTGYNTFQNCTRLTSVIIPNNITTIGNNAFGGCSSLASVTIGNSVTSIDVDAFTNCTGLTNITIPNGVTSIGGYAFYGCSSLASVTVEATTPPTLGSSAFNNTNDCPIYVPAASLTAYQTASGWSSYASRIQAIPTT